MERRQRAWDERVRLANVLAVAIHNPQGLPEAIAVEPRPDITLSENDGVPMDDETLTFNLRTGAEWPFFRDPSLLPTEATATEEGSPTRSPYDDW